MLIFLTGNVMPQLKTYQIVILSFKFQPDEEQEEFDHFTDEEEFEVLSRHFKLVVCVTPCRQIHVCRHDDDDDVLFSCYSGLQ